MGTQPTVLFVEDDLAVQGLVAFWLEDAGFRVLLADDGEQGLAIVRADRPDLVITDAMMPRLTGDELVEIMKSDPDLAAIPIVMATAAASPLRQERMMDRGCFAVLAKPLDEESFVATAHAALLSAGAADESDPADNGEAPGGS
jgi:CheY-like chemotaxis protein